MKPELIEQAMATKTLADMLFPLGVSATESSLLVEVVGEYAGPLKTLEKAMQLVRDRIW